MLYNLYKLIDQHGNNEIENYEIIMYVAKFYLKKINAQVIEIVPYNLHTKLLTS